MATSKDSYEKFLKEAEGIKKEKIPAPTMPVATFLAEGKAMSAFAEQRWDSKDGASLKSVEKLYGKSRLTRLQGLLSALEHAEAQLSESEEGTISQVPSLKKRALELKGEFASAISLILEEGKSKDLDAKLRELKARGKGTTSAAHVAKTLGGWAEVAEKLKKELANLDDFQMAWIGEAKTVSEQLKKLDQEAGPNPRRGRPKKGTPGAKERRDRLFVLAEAELKGLQKMAQHVFRHEEEACEQFSSAYRRVKSAEAYRRRVARAKGEELPGRRRRRSASTEG